MDYYHSQYCRHLYPLLLLLFILWILNIGLSFSAEAQTYQHRVYTEDDGLISNHVLEVTQAADGAMWFATIVGVSRYDGVHWQNFPSNATTPLPRDSYVQMCATPDSSVWLSGYYDGAFQVVYWKNQQWNTLALPSNVKNLKRELHNLAVWQQNGETKLAVGNHEVFVYSTVTQQWEEIVPEFEKNTEVSHFDFAFNADGELLAASHNGIRILQNGRWEPYAPSVSYPTLPILHFAFSPTTSNRLYLLGADWLGYLEKEVFTLLWQRENTTSHQNKEYTNLVVKHEDEIYFNVKSTLQKWVAQSEVTHVTFQHTLRTNWPTDILLDYEENIWVATKRGAVKLRAPMFNSFDAARGLFQKEVSAICQLQNGDILLGGNESFARFRSENDIENFYITATENGVNRRMLRCMQATDGIIYFASNYKGLGIWDGKSEVKWILPPLPNKRNPTSLIKEVFEREGEIYSVGDQVIYHYNKSLNTLEEVTSHRGSQFRKVQTLSDGKTYLIGDSIKLFENDTILPAYHLSSNYREAIYGIAEWQGRLWVATLQGLQVVAGDSIVPAPIMGNTIENAVYALLVDSRNNFWVGTSSGIYLIEADGGFTHYDMHSGLIGNELNRNALIEDASGKIWIGTDKGVSIFDYATRQAPHPSPRLALTTIATNRGRTFSAAEATSLPSVENSLEFGFVSPSFINENLLNYRYRLLNYDTEWRYFPSNAYPFVRYTNLDAGNYQFEVQTHRDDEVWSASVISGNITIETPFFQSPFFIIFIALLLTGIGYFVHLFIVRGRIRDILLKKVELKTQQLQKATEHLQKNYSDLQQTNTQLEELNQELDRFVYSVAHDLKSPLNSIKGLVEVIELADSPEERNRMLSLMLESLEKQTDFIDDLEKYARNKRKAIEPTEIDFTKLVEGCIQDLAFSDGAQEVHITYTVTQKASFVSDYTRCATILKNLLSNGIRYRNPYIEKSTVHINVTSDTEKAIITVKDNGIGISERLLPKIFDMFEKGQSKQKNSTGLGLYIVKETVEKLQGEISVESEVNKGSMFIVILQQLPPPRHSKSCAVFFNYLIIPHKKKAAIADCPFYTY